eukprot:TRINITY_DN6029_c0_g1_i6.p1 TRINITY_DN6029_c0_g1~~TRINITY_DN6029_c0_g1_i6.p1  ORF type:complete len:391 (+),score=72.88 TRINITY_DN6029_c0_g1_i6:424-1596(+)
MRAMEPLSAINDEQNSLSFWTETPGLWGPNTIKSSTPLEQLSVTHDTTDYLWYVTDFTVESSAETTLKINNVNDLVLCFVDGINWSGPHQGRGSASFNIPRLSVGKHQLQLLVMTVGLVNYGAHMETWKRGILGQVTLGNQPLTTGTWYHLVGLQGEQLQVYTPEGSEKVNWNTSVSAGKLNPLTWWKTSFPLPNAPAGIPIALDMSGMTKGLIWVNTRCIGRYWMVKSGSPCGSCAYNQSYNPNICRYDCGDYSQRYYHVPREWLNPTNNLIVIFEEIGGDPTSIKLVARNGGTVCGSQKEDWPNNDSTLSVVCPPGTYVTSVDFASFGTPTGNCGNYQPGTCSARSSKPIVESYCLGNSKCIIPVTIDVFGDPCPNETKSLAVQLTCK